MNRTEAELKAAAYKLVAEKGLGVAIHELESIIAQLRNEAWSESYDRWRVR